MINSKMKLVKDSVKPFALFLRHDLQDTFETIIASEHQIYKTEWINILFILVQNA
jgi:hypothetical protein